MGYAFFKADYLGGERSGGKAGRGSENKVPFAAAVSLNDDAHPLQVKLTPVPGFTFPAPRGEPIQPELVYSKRAG